MEKITVKGEKFNVEESVTYSGQAVVSKTVVKSDSGTITLFAFDKGEGLSEYTAPFDAMVVLLNGVAEVIISGRANTLRAGEAIIMPADIPHALKATERFKMMLVMIKGSSH